MPEATEAEQARVLRNLYLKLMFRGRQTAQRKPKLLNPALSFGVSLFFFVLLGLSAFMFMKLGLAGFAGSLHGLTFLMVGINLASTTGTLLFNTDEAEVLLHRPIKPRALLAAKVRVIVLVSLILAVALNACGFIVGSLRPGSSWLFLPAHMASIALEVLFCTSFVVLTYNLCLRWFGRERLDNLMTTVQVVVAMTAILAGQMVPRVIDKFDDVALQSAPAWLGLLPPAWFAGLDLLLMGKADTAPAQLLALTAVGMTALITWIAIGLLAKTYEQGLVTLNEAGPSAVKSAIKRGRFVRGLLRLPIIRLWLRDPVERTTFTLTLAGLTRARGVKLRVYPVLAQFLVYPIIIFGGGMGKSGVSELVGPYAMAFAGAFIAMMPAMVIDRLRPAEDSKAADLFWYAPLQQPSALFHGTRKAAILVLCVPGFLVAFVAGLLFLPDKENLLLLLPGMIALPLFSALAGVGPLFVPFSEPPEVQAHNAMGCFLASLFMFSSMVIAGVAGFTWSQGWFHWLLAVEIPVVVGLTFLARASMNRRVLRLER